MSTLRLWIKYNAKNKIRFYAVLLGISVFLYSTPVRADDFSSTNFILRAPILSDFGANSTSTNFENFSAGGQISVGESTSTNFIVRSGFLYFDEFSPKSQNWRWYDDETNVTPVTPLAAENTAPASIVNQNIIKLRVTVKETASIGGIDIKYKLQFSEYSDFSQGVTTVVEQGPCTTSSLWCYADGGGVDNAVIPSKVLTDPDACSGGVGDGCGTHNESATSTTTFDQKKDAATEFEFTIKHAGARANATYFFRVFDVTSNKAVALNTGETFPSLSTEGATLTFTIAGLAAGTTTEGVTTDATTTATSVGFGSLAFDAEIEAAQRLTLTTNATEGYQIFVYQRQGLNHVSYGGIAISEVTGTNLSPTSWATGCIGTAAGCYGYHAGDDALSGGSTRFAPNDTYAKFIGSSEEIAFNSGPVTSEVTDIIFKTKITNQQEAGDYSSTVVYIAVPTF